MPVPPLPRVGERNDHDMRGAGRDVLVAPRAAVGLAGGVAVDRAELGHPPGDRVVDEGGRAGRTPLRALHRLEYLAVRTVALHPGSPHVAVRSPQRWGRLGVDRPAATARC